MLILFSESGRNLLRSIFHAPGIFCILDKNIPHSMLVKTHACAAEGIHATLITVEVNVARGEFGVHIRFGLNPCGCESGVPVS